MQKDNNDVGDVNVITLEGVLLYIVGYEPKIAACGTTYGQNRESERHVVFHTVRLAACGTSYCQKH